MTEVLVVRSLRSAREPHRERAPEFLHRHRADAAAKALHLTTQQLLTKLSDGKTTIADVAKQQKVDINTVITAMTNADHTRIGDIVNKPWPKFGGGGPGRFGGAATPGGPAVRPGFGLGGAFGRLGAIALDPVAKALGVSPACLLYTSRCV